MISSINSSSLATEKIKSSVHRYVDGLNRHNAAILDEFVADDIQETVRLGCLRNVTAFPDYFGEIQDILAEGEEVVPA